MSDDAIVARASEQSGAADQGPTTFGELFGVREFRWLYLAGAVSSFGDYLAKAAVTVLVFTETHSVTLSAASFAITYLPWILGGPVLSTLAERHPYRRVMIVCDLLRMVLIAAVALPGLPVAAMLALLFLATLGNPPAQAARSAVLPLILDRRQVVAGIAANTTTTQAAQVVGYLVGAATASWLTPRAGLFADAATFALSAGLTAVGVRARPPAPGALHRPLLRQTGDGFRLVFGTPILRAIAMVVFGLTLFAVVPEGLAAAWARQTVHGPAQGVAQGVIMAASPVGFILGGLTVGRFVPAQRRQALIRPFAVLAPLALVPALLNPPVPVVALLALVCGFAVAGLMPTLNGIFVLALPHGFRARAHGVMQGGIQLTQGCAVLVTGALAGAGRVPPVVGGWSVAGVVLMLALIARWPTPAEFDAAVAVNGRLNGSATRVGRHRFPGDLHA